MTQGIIVATTATQDDYISLVVLKVTDGEVRAGRQLLDDVAAVREPVVS